MPVVSGIGGAVNGKHTVRNWSISYTADTKPYVASNTKGGTVRQIGNKDWNGSYSAYGSSPESLPGEALSFAGSIDGVKGANGDAIVDQVVITIDIEGGSIIEHTVSFSANGVLTLGADTSTDTTPKFAPTSIGCDVEIATPAVSPSYADLANVRTVTITITANNQAYVDSDSAGQTKRTEGNIDATLTISVYTDDFSSLPQPNDYKFVRVFVDATTFWEFEAMLFSEASDLLVDREGAAIVGATLNCGFSGYFDISGTPTEGVINEPDTTEFWPGA